MSFENILTDLAYLNPKLKPNHIYSYTLKNEIPLSTFIEHETELNVLLDQPFKFTKDHVCKFIRYNEQFEFPKYSEELVVSLIPDDLHYKCLYEATVFLKKDLVKQLIKQGLKTCPEQVLQVSAYHIGEFNQLDITEMKALEKHYKKKIVFKIFSKAEFNLFLIRRLDLDLLRQVELNMTYELPNEYFKYSVKHEKQQKYLEEFDYKIATDYVLNYFTTIKTHLYTNRDYTAYKPFVDYWLEFVADYFPEKLTLNRFIQLDLRRSISIPYSAIHISSFVKLPHALTEGKQYRDLVEGMINLYDLIWQIKKLSQQQQDTIVGLFKQQTDFDYSKDWLDLFTFMVDNWKDKDLFFYLND